MQGRLRAEDNNTAGMIFPMHDIVKRKDGQESGKPGMTIPNELTSRDQLCDVLMFGWERMFFGGAACLKQERV